MSSDGFMVSLRQRLTQLGTMCRRRIGMVETIKSGSGTGLRFDTGLGTNLFITGEYERPVQGAISSLVKQGDVCYDIGANLGFFTVLFGRLAGTAGIVYAFEPVPSNASVLERNARLNGLSNIQILRMACSRQSGSSELMLARHIGGAVLKSAGVPPDLNGSIVVETATIDSLVNTQKIAPPNVVKIDVEGAEMDVLEGMKKVLKEWGPAVIIEVDDASAAKCEEKLSKCREFLHEYNYQTELIPNSYADGKWYVRHFIATRASMASGYSTV